MDAQPIINKRRYISYAYMVMKISKEKTLEKLGRNILIWQGKKLCTKFNREEKEMM